MEKGDDGRRDKGQGKASERVMTTSRRELPPDIGSVGDRAYNLRETLQTMRRLELWITDMGGGLRAPRIEGYSRLNEEGITMYIPEKEDAPALYWTEKMGLVEIKDEKRTTEADKKKQVEQKRESEGSVSKSASDSEEGDAAEVKDVDLEKVKEEKESTEDPKEKEESEAVEERAPRRREEDELLRQYKGPNFEIMMAGGLRNFELRTDMRMYQAWKEHCKVGGSNRDQHEFEEEGIRYVANFTGM